MGIVLPKAAGMQEISLLREEISRLLACEKFEEYTHDVSLSGKLLPNQKKMSLTVIRM